MEKNKFEYSVLFLILVLFIIIFLGYKAYSLFANKNKYTIIVNPLTVIECNKNKCETNLDYKKYTNNKYYAYINSNIIKNASFDYDSKNDLLNVYDGDTIINRQNERFVLSNKGNISIIDHEIQDMNEVDLDKINPKYKDNLNYGFFIELDFDNDGVFEKLYYLKTGNDNGYYSALVYGENDYYEVLSDNSSYDVYSLNTYYVNSVMDVNSDGVYEIIVSQIGFDAMSYCSQIYGFNNGQLVPFNECKMVNY